MISSTIKSRYIPLDTYSRNSNLANTHPNTSKNVRHALINFQRETLSYSVTRVTWSRSCDSLLLCTASTHFCTSASVYLFVFFPEPLYGSSPSGDSIVLSSLSVISSSFCTLSFSLNLIVSSKGGVSVGKNNVNSIY